MVRLPSWPEYTRGSFSHILAAPRESTKARIFSQRFAAIDDRGRAHVSAQHTLRAYADAFARQEGLFWPPPLRHYERTNRCPALAWVVIIPKAQTKGRGLFSTEQTWIPSV